MEIKSRGLDRHSVGLPTLCRVTDGEQSQIYPGHIRDVSLNGAGLLLDCRFEPGTILDFDTPDIIGQPKTLQARVVHATALPGGQWLHGCVLVKPMSEAELQRFLGQDKVEPETVEAPPASPPLASPPSPPKMKSALDAFVVDQVFASWFNHAQDNGRTSIPNR